MSEKETPTRGLDEERPLPEPPDSPLAAEVRTLIMRAATPAIANHSIRTYVFAELLAAHRGARPGRDYDPELLFFACALHDVGLTHLADGRQRFEVDGADFAADFLSTRGVPGRDVDIVWEAIALNTSGGIAERRGPICEMTRTAVVIDFGAGTEFVPDSTAARVHRLYPRQNLATALVDAVVAPAVARPEKAPRFSMTADLVDQRSLPGGGSVIEEQARAVRWRAYD
ncbi:hypothetical protein Pth03_62370 [Planotetraspora thailandica]|uniref:HD domain-containing protein n=1 Tax=Planotetraspora thailandica TaxID=487172 RepID=A0A8J3V701_9ACTN|nr:HD domain-containing protein [Planotetraspora thailandica]GII57848.1 hypothetical protein Pth03_62370 [Planotetraspora thailandica]